MVGYNNYRNVVFADSDLYIAGLHGHVCVPAHYGFIPHVSVYACMIVKEVSYNGGIQLLINATLWMHYSQSDH